MTNINMQEVNEYFDVTPELLPYIPELLADLWALGSSPEVIIEWIRSLVLPPKQIRILDLGCGKGAVAIPLAKELKFQIIGIDFFEPFILEARKRAKQLGAANLCTFEFADMRQVLKSTRNFDIVIYSAVGGMLGSFDQCVYNLRQTIRSGGYMIIDDGFRLTSVEIDFPGYEHYVPHEATIRQLTCYGDTIISEKIFSIEDIKQINQRNTELITKRAKALAKQYPELANAFFNHLEKEKQECEILERDVAWAMWLLQKD
ncbi:MAG: methyltransferase domain-containing protein [bacterium]|nr:MAG: methyltransferase domain-containing protein [bacterium]